MEVHARTHTERKKITHYIWEFLMLFLAVFWVSWQKISGNTRWSTKGKDNI